MICPSCGAQDAYQGLMGISCPNSSCKHGTKVPKASSPDPLATANIVPNGGFPSGKIASRGYSGSVQGQQALALDVLKKVVNYSGIHDSIIAGGAPRNWYENKLANDIDIFTYENSIDISSLEASLKVQWNLGPGWQITLRKSNQNKYGHAGNSIIKRLWDFSINGQPFQLIHINKNWFETQSGLVNPHISEYVKETFDFDICKCWIDAYGVKNEIMAFEDFQNKTLTVSISKMQQYDRINSLHKRAAKLQGYYPNHKIVISP